MVALPGLRRRRAGFVAVRRCVWLAATGGHGSPRLGRSRSHEPLVASRSLTLLYQRGKYYKIRLGVFD